MYLLIVSLIAVCSILLILVVLAQNSKGGGLSDQFGGSASSQMMGVKRTSDLLEKITWGLAIAVLVLSLGANFTIPRQASEEEDAETTSANIEKAKETVLPQQESPVIQQDIPTEGPAEEEENK